MVLFETMLILMLVAIVFLQLSRTFKVPYPTMLAIAGIIVATLPWAPDVRMDPALALTLFVTLGLFDAAYNLPPRMLRKDRLPLIALAGAAVVFTAAAVAFVGVAMVGLPLAVAVTVGAIVAPPDAAAAAALLSRYDLPQRTSVILRGESLLNDAVSLLIYTTAVAVAAKNFTIKEYLPEIAMAVPGGLLLGFLIGRAFIFARMKLSGTLGGTLLEFVTTFGTWVLAERLNLSAILAVVSLAMVIAHEMPTKQNAIHRLASNAVWESMVFLLNVLAFLLMGLQARHIVLDLWSENLSTALLFCGAVFATVVIVRVVWVFAYGSLMALLYRARWSKHRPQTKSQTLIAGWCGIRGLVTMATALALPADFPSRDLIQLCALFVVLGTLIVQGLTLGPLLQKLHFKATVDAKQIYYARVALSDAALQTLPLARGRPVEILREVYEAERKAALDGNHPREVSEFDDYHRAAVEAKRRRLLELRRSDQIDEDAFRVLERELDYAELSAAKPDDQNLIEG